MIPVHRREDNELLGYLRPVEGALGRFVPATLFGHPLSGPGGEDHARRCLDRAGLDYLAQEWLLSLPGRPDPFEHVIAALVHGSGYERIAGPGCSDRTIRRRVDYWSQPGIAERIHALALEAYDRMIGLEPGELSVDGCITKAP